MTGRAGSPEATRELQEIADGDGASGVIFPLRHQVPQRLIGPGNLPIANRSSGSQCPEHAAQSAGVDNRIESRSLPVLLVDDVAVSADDQRPALFGFGV